MNPAADTRPGPGAATLQLLRFLCVGGAVALLQFALVHALHDRLGLSRTLSVSAGYLGSVVFHFLANRRLTFGQRGAVDAAQVQRYLALAALNYGVTLAVFHVLAARAGLDLALAAAIGATTGVGFLASRHWVFTPPKDCP